MSNPQRAPSALQVARRPRYAYDLQDSADRGMWACLSCGCALMYSVLSGRWSHFSLETECRRPIPRHEPSDRQVETGQWP